MHTAYRIRLQFCSSHSISNSAMHTQFGVWGAWRVAVAWACCGWPPLHADDMRPTWGVRNAAVAAAAAAAAAAANNGWMDGHARAILCQHCGAATLLLGYLLPIGGSSMHYACCLLLGSWLDAHFTGRQACSHLIAVPRNVVHYTSSQGVLHACDVLLTLIPKLKHLQCRVHAGHLPTLCTVIRTAYGRSITSHHTAQGHRLP